MQATRNNAIDTRKNPTFPPKQTAAGHRSGTLDCNFWQSQKVEDVNPESERSPRPHSGLAETTGPKWARHLNLADITLDATVPLGQRWGLEGGLYAGLLQGWTDQPDYHLIAAPNPGPTICMVEGKQTPFGPQEARSFRDGLSNCVCWLQRGSPAARWTQDLSIEGRKDWYLPSMAELFLVAGNLGDRLFAGVYWSSSRSDEDRVWCLDLSKDATIREFAMAGAARVLPVRRA